MKMLIRTSVKPSKHLLSYVIIAVTVNPLLLRTSKISSLYTTCCPSCVKKCIIIYGFEIRPPVNLIRTLHVRGSTVEHFEMITWSHSFKYRLYEVDSKSTYLYKLVALNVSLRIDCIG